MTLHNDQTRSIARALARHAPDSAPAAGRVAKYPLFKKIVTDTVAAHPPHTRLPPVRTLAENLGISLVTAQRVITELIADGVVYSRPRAGVFVAEPSTPALPTPAPLAETGGPPSFESSFRFGTGSDQPHQRALWADLTEGFGHRYPNTRVDLVCSSDPTDPGSLPLDVYERLDWNATWSGDEDRLLDLREFAPGDLAARCTEQGTLPLYFRGNYLFFNRALLEKLGAPAPGYRDFAGQLAYFAQVAPLLEAHGLDPLPASVQQPITSLGGAPLEDFFSLVRARRADPERLSAFVAAVEKTLAFGRLSRRAPGFRNPEAQRRRVRFKTGQDPLFLGHGVDFWEFGESDLPFPLGILPSLCADDTLFLWPMVGCVSRTSRRPAESMRFLAHLVGGEAQARLARTGAYPVDRASGILPPTDADPGWLAGLLAASRPMSLPDRERFYLAINVLNNELWHALLDHISAPDAVRQALDLSRSYLRQHPLPDA